jgi:D-sedoheptulose 7-phosphate isomerase
LAKKNMNKHLHSLLLRYPLLETCRGDIEKTFLILHDCFKAKGKLLLCGNGGSATDCDHIAGELLKGFGKTRSLPLQWEKKLGDKLAENLQEALPAIPLPCITGFLTAYMNDCDPAYVYAQATWALGRPNDVLFCISTSGNSKNILHAVEVARHMGLKTIGLTGQTGGKLKALVDSCICVPQTEVFKVQEYHLPIYHSLCLWLEDVFFEE